MSPLRLDPMYCPVCNQRFTSQCRCLLGDKTCANGHHWHRCPVHKVVLLGKADHTLPSNTCRCPQETQP